MNADELRATRAMLGMTREQLAAALGTSANVVYMWETGRRQPLWRMLALALESLQEGRGIVATEARHIAGTRASRPK